MRKLYIIITMLLISSMAQAQTEELEGRFSLRAGYGLGNTFRERGFSLKLEGLQIGADVPIARRIPKIGSLYFSPTILFGGSTRQGADTDGNVYRLMFNVKRSFGEQGFYGGFGVGYSITDARRFVGAGPNNQQFTNASGLTGQVLMGYIFNLSNENRYKPLLEFSYFAGSDSKISGFSFDVGVRF